jgi:hypothetical protein
LLFNYLDLLYAHNEFRLSPKGAVQKYATAATNMLEGGSFGRLLIQQQLPTIRENLLLMPNAEATDLTAILAESWHENELLSDFIQSVLDQLLFRYPSE